MRYRRARPMFSFALAACFILALAGLITGYIQLDPGPGNPSLVLPVFGMALIAIALLFEW